MGETRPEPAGFSGVLAATTIRTVVQATRRLAAFATVILLVRIAGVELAGSVFLAVAVGAVVAPVVNRGLSQTLLRTIPSVALHHDEPDQRALFAAARLKVLQAGVVVIVVAFLIERTIGPDGPAIWTFGVALGAAISLADAGASYLRAIERRLMPEVVEATVPVLFLFGILLVDARSLSVTNLLWWRLFLECAAAAVLTVGRGSDAHEAPDRNSSQARQLTRRQYAPLWLTMLAWVALGQLDVLFLGLTQDATAIGVYVPALRMCELLVFPYVVLNPYITTMAARAKHDVGEPVIRRHYERTACIALTVIAPVAGLLLAQPQEVMERIFQISDPRLPAVIRILVIGFLMFMWVGPAPAVAYGVGTGRDIAAAALLVLGAIIVTTSLGVLIAGMVGAAVATASCFPFMGVACVAVVRRARIRLPTRRLALVAASVPVSASVAVILAPQSPIQAMALAALAATGAAAAIGRRCIRAEVGAGVT